MGRSVDIVELVLAGDVVWSAIPLGILTVMELYTFGQLHHISSAVTLEIIKLVAVCIDAVTLSGVIFFEICHRHSHEEEESALLSSP